MRDDLGDLSMTVRRAIGERARAPFRGAKAGVSRGAWARPSPRSTTTSRPSSASSGCSSWPPRPRGARVTSTCLRSEVPPSRWTVGLCREHARACFVRGAARASERARLAMASVPAHESSPETRPPSTPGKGPREVARHPHRRAPRARRFRRRGSAPLVGRIAAPAAGDGAASFARRAPPPRPGCDKLAAPIDDSRTRSNT
jgi:hypothetical protein